MFEPLPGQNEPALSLFFREFEEEAEFGPGTQVARRPSYVSARVIRPSWFESKKSMCFCSAVRPEFGWLRAAGFRRGRALCDATPRVEVTSALSSPSR